MRQVSPLFQTDKINAPVLLAENIKDPNNNSGEAVQFVKNLKKRNVSVTYLENEGDIFFGRNPDGRRKFYTALEEFLEVNLKRK
ncbi:hypothetical protein D3C86_1739420 [compost metagenome]